MWATIPSLEADSQPGEVKRRCFLLFTYVVFNDSCNNSDKMRRMTGLLIGPLPRAIKGKIPQKILSQSNRSAGPIFEPENYEI